MARFTRVFLPSDVSPTEAWRLITEAIKNGNKSVEVLSRVIDAEEKWELRSWDGVRKDKSNSASASPNTDY